MKNYLDKRYELSEDGETTIYYNEKGYFNIYNNVEYTQHFDLKKEFGDDKPSDDVLNLISYYTKLSLTDEKMNDLKDILNNCIKYAYEN